MHPNVDHLFEVIPLNRSYSLRFSKLDSHRMLRRFVLSDDSYPSAARQSTETRHRDPHLPYRFQGIPPELKAHERDGRLSDIGIHEVKFQLE
jgi:hypothetical protein